MFIWNFLFAFWFYTCGGLLLVFITYLILEWIAETRYISDLYERIVLKRVLLVYTALFFVLIILF